MAVKKTVSTVFIFLFLLACSTIHAEKLIFSGTPAAGKNFLCRFTVKKSLNRKMEIRGAEKPPQQSLTNEIYLTGKLQVRENSTRAFLFQFTVDAFSWLEKNERRTIDRVVTIDFAMDKNGNLRLCRYAADVNPVAVNQPPPPALQNALLQLGRSLLTNAGDILGPDTNKNIGDFWSANDLLINTLAENRKIFPINRKDWDSKVLFTRKDQFFQIPVNRIDFNMITNRISGYDSRINMTYLFPVDSPETTGALSYTLDWMECVDKIMPENNPVFAGTKIVEVMTMSVQRDLIPIP